LPQTRASAESANAPTVPPGAPAHFGLPNTGVPRLSNAGLECDALRRSFGAKLRGDAALGAGQLDTALGEYTAALVAAPAGLLNQLQTDAAAGARDAPPPFTIAGLTPSRKALAIIKERERATPGEARWLYEALLGRSRVELALSGGARALSDAREAAALCPQVSLYKILFYF